MTDSKYIPGKGNPFAKLMIIGESPGSSEIAAGQPFVGPSGRELDRLLGESGIKRSELWITNTVKYFVPPASNEKIPFSVRAKNAGIDVGQCIRELQVEINEIKPNCILALGGTALWATTGKTKISNYRGSILRGMGRKVVGTYHPAHLLHQAGGEIKGYWNRQVMVFDFKRALAESATPDYEIPSRLLRVAKNSWDVYDFFQRYKKLPRPALDIEALDCIPTCLGIAYTPYEGLSIPLWNKRGISNIADAEMVRIWDLIAQNIFTDVTGQNFKYDQDKLYKLGLRIKKLGSDTMLKAFTINPEFPKSLAFNTSIYTREPYYKDEGADFDPSKQSIDDLFIYNARDACVTKEIDLAMNEDLDELGLRDFYENFIMELHPLYLDIENEGFCVDEPRREILLQKYISWSERLRYELYQITGTYINVNSPKQVASLLYDVYGLPRPKRADDGLTGEEVITGHLNRSSKPLKSEVRRALEIVLEERRVNKTVSTYLMAMPDYDGKMKTTCFICLRTGRTQTGQQDPPIRPAFEYRDIDNKKKKKSLGMAFQTITKHGDIGEDVRSMLVPEPGYIFLGADSAQAEARVVFLLADDEEALHAIDAHDYHALTASWFFGGTEDDYSKRKLGYESPIRFAGKTLRHAGHLGAGKRRAATELNTQARKYKIYLNKETKDLLSITEAKAGEALGIFHARQPKIQGVFHAGIVSSLEKQGRKLTAALPYGIQSRTGGIRTFFERWDEELFREAFSYIPQRSVSDNTKAAALRLRRREPKLTRILVEAHDGLLFMIPERELDYYGPMVQEEMQRPLSFENCSLSRHELIIPCELEIGYNYQELNKWKKVTLVA